MATDITWTEAQREFLLHVEATRAQKTHRFYVTQLRQLVDWADTNQVTFLGFGKRHLDRFLVERGKSGKAPTTLHHDAICAKAFYRWCAKNDLIERSPLAEYEIRNAPAPARYMPSSEEMEGLLGVMHDYWNPTKNDKVRYLPVQKRIFHRDRNYAIVLALLDSACRIGEIIHLKVDDYNPKARQIVIRQSKGREPRTLPISAELVEAIGVWLHLRAKHMANVPPAQDEGWLFLSEYGTRLEESRFLKAVKSYLRWAGMSDNITLHSLRRFSLNRLAKTNLLAAQQMAGHKETKTTLLYTKLDADFIRDVHDTVGVVKSIVHSKREARRRKIV